MIERLFFFSLFLFLMKVAIAEHKKHETCPGVATDASREGHTGKVFTFIVALGNSFGHKCALLNEFKIH